MSVQEGFLPLENYRNESNKPVQLEIFPEEAKAEIINVLDAKPKDIGIKSKKIETLDDDNL